MTERQNKQDERQGGDWLAEQVRRLRTALAALVAGSAVARPVPVPIPLRIPSGRRRYY